MLKRFFVLLLALALLIAAPALAEDAPFDALYRLVLRNGQQDTLLGSGVVCVQPDVLVTSVAAIPSAGKLYAVGAGGEFAVTQMERMAEGCDLALLLLDSATPTQPLRLTPAEAPLRVMGVLPDGRMTAADASHLTVIPYQGMACLLFSGEENLLPGSVLLDESGGLAGVTLATYGEGAGRYLALTADEIYRGILSDTSAAPVHETPDGVTWVSGFTVTPLDGRLHVDWAGCIPREQRQGRTLTVFFANEANPYYSYIQADEDENTMDVPAAPGQRYSVWLQLSEGEANFNVMQPDSSSVTVDTNPSHPFNRLGYKDQACYLGVLPADADSDPTAMIPPLEPITAEALAAPDSKFFLQAVSKYRIKRREEAQLLIVLTTPEKNTFLIEAGFIFDPALTDGDVWNAEITELFTDYLCLNETGQFAPGSYTLAYYLDGGLASQLTFTLE